MTLESYLIPNAANENRGETSELDSAKADSALEDLIHGKSQILGKKLEILSAEIRWRLHLASQNLAHLETDQSRLQDSLNRLDRAAHYHLLEHQEKSPFYRKLFDIETEKRSQQVECWRDVVMVMKDFLAVWEAHAQSKTRAMFIQHVGTGTEGYL